MTAAPAFNTVPDSLYSQEAEQYVLAALMMDNVLFDSIEGIVTHEDFYESRHQIIFRAILRLAADGKPFDCVTTSNFLGEQKRIGKGSKEENLLDEVGGFTYVSLLVRDSIGGVNVRAYTDIVRAYSRKRKLVHIAEDIRQSVYFPEGKSIDELIMDADRNIDNLQVDNSNSQGGFLSISSLLSGAVNTIDKKFQSDNLITGVPTGWGKFDEMTSGCQPGDLIIVAGRPSMGKTTLAINIGENIAIKANMTVAVFSLEMPGESLAVKMMASTGRIDHGRLRSGSLQEEDWGRMTSAISMLNNDRIFVNDCSSLKPAELAMHARRLQKDHGQLGCIIVDYIQLMKPDVQHPGRKDIEIGDTSASLKRLAKELKCPVIALSQLNRDVEKRGDKRPVMSDLKESSSLEQDADMIMFLYRDEVYNETSEDTGYAEVNIAKQRNGPTGVVPFRFYGQYQRFEEATEGHLPSWLSGKKCKSSQFTDED